MDIFIKKRMFLPLLLNTITSAEAFKKDADKIKSNECNITTFIHEKINIKKEIKKNREHDFNKKDQALKEIIKKILIKKKTNDKTKTKTKRIKIKQKRKFMTYFSPPIDGQIKTCTEKIIEEINKAKNSILIQAYSFTSQPITDALIKAHKKGVMIKVILDKTYANKPCSVKLRSNGILVYVDTLKQRNKNDQHNHGIAHNKVMIIDKKMVITGSFNFTNAAEHNNTENILVLISKKLANNYVINYLSREKHSTLIIESKKHKKSQRKHKNKKKIQCIP